MNSTVHLGRSIDFWPHEFLSVFTEALENNPRLCFEKKDGETIHSVLVREAHAHGQNAPRYTAKYAFSEACIAASHRIERIMTHILKMEGLAVSPYGRLGAGSIVRTMAPDILRKFQTLSLENVQ